MTSRTDALAAVLAEHQPTGGASGVEGGWNRHCTCGAMVETLWDRDGDSWDLPFANHQADQLAALLGEPTVEWRVKLPPLMTIFKMPRGEAQCRAWLAAGNPGKLERRESIVGAWQEIA